MPTYRGVRVPTPGVLHATPALTRSGPWPDAGCVAQNLHFRMVLISVLFAAHTEIMCNVSDMFSGDSSFPSQAGGA